MSDTRPQGSDTAVAGLKRGLRREALALRDALAPNERARHSRRISDAVLEVSELAGRDPVGGYWPIRSEVDPRTILIALAGMGRGVALPVLRLPELAWHLWQPDDPLVRGSFGLQEPEPDSPETSPHALLVPLCAFDRRGNRLGYGKGHFDRAIAGLSARHSLLTIGLAFAAQEVASVPCEPHDRVLDMIVTERETIRPGLIPHAATPLEDAG